MKKLILTFLSLILAIVLGGTGALAANHWHELYRFHDLGEFIPTALNNRGDVTGLIRGQHPPPDILVLWTFREGAQEIGHGYPGILPTGINDKRQIAGYFLNGANDIPYAFLWTEKNGFQYLENLGGRSGGSAINARGEIVGWSQNGYMYPTAPGDFIHAVLWTKSGSLQDLGTLPGGRYSSASGINDKGEIVGSSNVDQTFPGFLFNQLNHAVLWTKKNGWQDLGGLPAGSASFAVAINNLTQVIGNTKIDDQYRGFIWTAKQGVKDLAPADGNSYFPHAINDRGQVVGEMLPNSSGGSYSVPFLWTKNGGIKDLNDLLPVPLPEGGKLITAAAINAEGQIIGKWQPEEGQARAYLLTPYVGHCWYKD